MTNKRDTDPSELHPDSERTPIEGPGQWLPVFRRFDKLDRAVAHVADDQSASRVLLEGLTREVRHLGSRVTALELSSRWLPMLFSALAVAISIWSALRIRG
jgi:hypothetical protein